MDTARYSDTTHGRFIQHMDLATAWLRANGRRTTAQDISRTMGRLTAAQLAELLAERHDQTLDEITDDYQPDAYVPGSYGK
jgi:hypothetical protein